MNEKFKALGHEVRLTIYRALGEKKLCVCEISELLEMSQPAVSQHLSTLREADLIESERHGQWTFYSPVQNSFRDVIADLFDDIPDEFRRTIKNITRKNLCDLRDAEGHLSTEG